MDKIFKIFVSSTFTDLEDIRLQAMQGVLKAGHMPIMMEGFAATSTQKEIIKKKITNSDAYILIVGSKYGTIDLESGLSYTEWEYNYALDNGIPIFTMILEERYIQERVEQGLLKLSDIEIASENYKDFVCKASSRQADFISSIEQVKSMTEAGIMQLVKDFGSSMIGWVSATVIDNVAMLQKELDNLRKTRSELQVKLTNAETKGIRESELPSNSSFDGLLSKMFAPNATDSILEQGIVYIMEFVKEKVEQLKITIENHRGNIAFGYDSNRKDQVLLLLGKDNLYFLADYSQAKINVRLSTQEPYFNEDLDILYVKDDILYSEKYSEPLSLDYLNKILSRYDEVKKKYS